MARPERTITTGVDNEEPTPTTLVRPDPEPPVHHPQPMITASGPVTAPRPAPRPEPRIMPLRPGPLGVQHGPPPRPPGPYRPPARPRIEPEPGILGLSRHTRSRLGARLFNLFFVFVFALILVQMIVALLNP
ncbi:MAG: peptidase caspase catalytic subunit [Pseudonocardia sp.]|nr:peptidase caspase catalytic subunit [Pseudonocardia sp.]